MQRQFVLRILTGLVAAPTLVCAAWLGGWWWAGLIGLASAVGAWELYRMSRAENINPVGWLGIPCAVAIPVVAHGVTQYGWAVPLGAVMLPLLAVLVVVLLARGPGERPLASAAVTTFGVLYTAGTLTFGYGLRYHPYVIGAGAGAALVVLPVWLTWASDTGAYLFGRMIGGAKLMPSVSPGKTIAGAVGGLLMAVGMSFAYTLYVLKPVAEVTMTTGGIVMFGVIIAVAAQVGDLVESLLKREAGVKDSSGVFPGHGGVLDRLDSLFFVLPVAYLLLPHLLVVAPLASQ